MSYIVHARPMSQVGFRLMGATSPARAAALSGIGTLGDDTATLATIGFSQAQIAQILSAHQSGALSDASYQELVSGNVDPATLSDFLAADIGAPPVTGISSTTLILMGVGALLLILAVK
jgi:hypothetical protein